MYKNLLVAMALDHDLSPKMLQIARAICAEGGSITALHVIESAGATATASLSSDLQQAGSTRAQELFDEKLKSFPDVTPKILQGHVSRTVVEFAETMQADCILMGSHRPGLVDYLLGSTAARVVRHAPCSVHVFRDH